MILKITFLGPLVGTPFHPVVGKRRQIVIGMRLIICSAVILLTASQAPTCAQDLELRDLDLTGWDCLTKLEGAANTQDDKERNRQKNRSPVELAGMKIVSVDTAAFLQRVADYDRTIQAKHRSEIERRAETEIDSV